MIMGICCPTFADQDMRTFRWSCGFSATPFSAYTTGMLNVVSCSVGPMPERMRSFRVFSGPHVDQEFTAGARFLHRAVLRVLHTDGFGAVQRTASRGSFLLSIGLCLSLTVAATSA